MEQATTFIGLDVHKAAIAVAIADGGCRHAARYLGEIPNTPEALSRLARKLGARGQRLSLCYEAGPCGYGVHPPPAQRTRPWLRRRRALADPTPPGRAREDRPTGRGQPSPAPPRRRADAGVGARSGARGHARPGAGAARGGARLAQGASAPARLPAPARARPRRQRLDAGAPGRWLTTVRFEHPAQQIVFQDYVHAVADAERRRDALTEQIRELLPTWPMAPVVAALQALRGMALIAAATLVAEVGDLTRFATPRQLMAHPGLVPSEHSSGARARRGGLTKAGNAEARRVMIEAAWTYRLPARVSRILLDRHEGVPKEVRDRPRLEGAAPPLRPLPAARRPGQADAAHRRRDRARTPGLRLGHRAPRRTRRGGASRVATRQGGGPTRSPIRWRPGREAGPRSGEPPPALFERDGRATLDLRQGQLRDEPGSCGTQPAHQSLTNRRYARSRLPPWATAPQARTTPTAPVDAVARPGP
jgi:transposase